MKVVTYVKIYQLWLRKLFLLQALADGVIPNEYGINPEHKLKIGSKVKCHY